MKKITFLVLMLCTSFIWGNNRVFFGMASETEISPWFSTSNNTGSSIPKKIISKGVDFPGGALVDGICSYTLRMSDSYGDGWNGNTMDVLVNGTVVLDDVTFTTENSGYYHEITFDVADADDVTTIWNGGGSYGSETSYEIWDSEGNVVGSGAEDDILTGTITATCPSCILPGGINFTNFTTEGVDVSWNAVGSALDYEYKVVYEGVDPDTGTALVSGITASTQVTINTLSSGTSYEIFLRSQCSATETSAWSGQQFSTSIGCGDNFYDSGGSAGNYTNGENETWTFYPNDPAEFVQINFSSVSLESCCDELNVYDGADTSAPILASDIESAGVYTSSTAGQPLTVSFSSDGSVTFSGWEATIACVTCTAPINLTATNILLDEATFSWDAVSSATNGYEWVVVIDGGDPDTAADLVDTGITTTTTATATGLASGTAYDLYVRSDCDADGLSPWSTAENFTTGYGCGNTFYDSGGATGSYSDGENETWTFYPNDPAEFVQVNFTSVSLESCCDVLNVYDGADTSAPTLGFDIESPGVYTASVPGQPLTVSFTSDGSVTFAGWEATISCVTCLAPINLVASNILLDEATLTWDAVSSATNGYEWVVVVEGGDPDTAADVVDTGITTSTTATATGLSSGTIYDVYVRSDCDTDGISPWSSMESFTTNYGCGNNFYDSGGVSGNYQNNENLSWTFVAENADEFVQIDFTSVNLETCCDHITIYDGPDTSAPVLAADLEAPGIFTASTPGGALTVTFTSDGSVVSSGWEATISCVTCIAPPNIEVSNLTSNSATVSWDALAGVVGYEYIVVFEGVDPETGSPIFAGSTTDTFVDLSGLDDATSYDVYVRTECEVGNFSPWSAPENFLTFCDPVTDFSENFDSVTTPDLPLCWDEILDNGATTFASVNTVGFVSFSGSNSLDLYNSNSPLASNIMLVSPMVSNLDAGTHWFRFYARNNQGTQDVEVGTMSDPNDGSTFTALEIIDITTEWDEYTVDFTTYNGTDDFIVIRRLSSSMFTNVYIDNAIWELRPTCVYPDDLIVNSTTVDGANVTWEAVTNASNGYSYVVVEQGGDPDVPGDVVVSGTSAIAEVDVTGLQSGTIYEIYVMADCGATDGMSDWSTGEQFTTAYGCGDDFFDAGGEFANYSNGENETWTIYPNDPTEYVQVNFTMVNLESCCDVLSVYDGADNTAPVLGFDIENPGVYTSSTPGQPLTVTFTSDGSVTFSGWEAQIECVTCISPVNIQIDELFADGATVTWNAMADAIDGYEWVVVLAGDDPETEAIASGVVTENTVTIEGLESGTDYEVFLISDCGDVNGLSGFSPSVPFTTLCQAPTGLAITVTGFEEVEFSWDAVPGAIGYEFVIVENGMPLSEENYVGVGTIGSGDQNSLVVEYLTPGVDYDLYLRIICDEGFYGEWGSTDFTTMGVDNNTIEGFDFYPNPVKDNLNLSATNTIDTVVVYNMLGQVVMTEKPNQTSASIDMSGLQAGAYIVKVSVGISNGTYRIIKQ